MKTGINGFGRFGLHLFKYWLDRSEEAKFSIEYINDDFLSLNQAFEIIKNDTYVKFNKYKVQKEGQSLVVLKPNGTSHVIQYSNTESKDIPWIRNIDFMLECSGKNTTIKNCEPYLKQDVKRVIISATSWDCDNTLVYGYNHEDFKPEKDKVISYGSCTVNAYFALSKFLNNQFGIKNSDVNVVHNIQEYRLHENQTLIRKFCTLEKQAQDLLPYHNEENFIVVYTVTPYTGVSAIDFRFQFEKNITRDELVFSLQEAMENGPLKNLYSFDEVDIGPEVYNCTTFSTVFIKEGLKKVGDNFYLQGYFDTENSVNRYYDLVNYITTRVS